MLTVQILVNSQVIYARKEFWFTLIIVLIITSAHAIISSFVSVILNTLTFFTSFILGLVFVGALKKVKENTKLKELINNKDKKT